MEATVARGLLEAKRAEAMGRLRDLGVVFDDIVEAARDSNGDDEHDSEGMTIAASRSQVGALIAANRSKLEEIDGALQRVAAGGFGRCVTCGTPIPDARLEARPSTPWCVACAT